MLDVFPFLSFSNLIYWPFLFFAVLLSLFLFWRSGRHEFLDSRFLFDLSFFSLIGGLIFGRAGDFLTNPSYYSWSVARLIFFNVWPGFSYWGAVIGILLFAWIYLRNKRENYWLILDLAASALALFQSFLGLAGFLGGKSNQIKVNLEFVNLPSISIETGLIAFVYYLIIFWILRRLAKRKRHTGFFICMYLVFASILDIVIAFFSKGDLVFGIIPNDSIIPFGFFVFAIISWFVLAKRSFTGDCKSIFAFALLALFGIRRVVSSADEAGKVAKTILFSPLFLLRSLYSALKNLSKEIAYSFFELVSSFKGKR